jgi:hypothetical protein
MSSGYTVSRYLYIYALVCDFFSFQSGCPTNTLTAYFTFPVKDTGSAHVKTDMKQIEGDVFT